jgi:hypothetical protein
MDKFYTLAESIIHRYQSGGFLAGDLVKLREDAFTHEWMKKQAPHFVERIKEMVESGLNLRITAVKGLRPAASGSVQAANQTDDFYCDVIREHAPGMMMDFVTLPACLLVLANPEDGNLASIPDAMRAKDRTHIKPKEVEQQLAQSDSKMPGGNKWNDSKPGGGNGPKTLQESYIDALENPTKLELI